MNANRLRKFKEDLARARKELNEEIKKTMRETKRRMVNRRKELGLTQDDIAFSIGKTRSQYTNIESGRLGLTLVNLLALCSVLETTPNELLGFKDD